VLKRITVRRAGVPQCTARACTAKTKTANLASATASSTACASAASRKSPRANTMDKITFECPEQGCGFSTESESKFASHLIDVHAFRPGQVSRVLAKIKKQVAQRTPSGFQTSSGRELVIARTRPKCASRKILRSRCIRLRQSKRERCWTKTAMPSPVRPCKKSKTNSARFALSNWRVDDR